MTVLIISRVHAQGTAVRNTFRHLWQDQRAIVTSPLRMDRTDAVLWGSAAASTLYLAYRWDARPSADERTAVHLDRSQDSATQDFLEGFTYLGSAEVLFSLSLMGYGWGTWRHQSKLQSGSAHLFEALVHASVWSNVIKVLTGRNRPGSAPPFRSNFEGPAGFFDGPSGHRSFVSGHATLAFATAAVLNKESGTPWVGVPAYLVAGGVAFSRVYLEKHWVSDVVAGAALGHSLGIFVEHQRHGPSKSAGRLHPWWRGDAVGVAWTRSW